MGFTELSGYNIRMNPWRDRPEQNKYNSRRYKSMWTLTLLFSALLVLPQLITILLGLPILIIIDGMQYVTLISFTWGSWLVSDYKSKTINTGPVEQDLYLKARRNHRQHRKQSASTLP